MSDVHVKQVIVMRRDLNTRKGKYVSQGGHSVMKVFFDNMEYVEEKYDSELNFSGRIKERYYKLPIPMNKTGDDIKSWIDGIFTKICVSVNSEQELMDVYNKAVELGLPCSLIEDNGLTEFHGVKTKTCCAIGPADSTLIDPITGHLPLL
jgi:PTH2 family peptidyl-tRNA hydrolase